MLAMTFTFWISQELAASMILSGVSQMADQLSKGICIIKFRRLRIC